MVKRAATLPVPSIEIDRNGDDSLQHQLYDAIRTGILEGRFRPGTRLPSTRDLARELRIARNTVLIAYDMLQAEGYLESRVGAGTTVSSSLPDDLSIADESGFMRAPGDPGRTPSKRGRAFARTTTDLSAGVPGPFSPGVPPIDEFPFRTWNRISARHWRGSPLHLYSYDGAAGYEPLREAIAEHLSLSRGVRADASRVIITGGGQQGIDLAVRALLDPGDTAWIENPCYRGALGALRAAGAELIPVAVDSEGLDIDAGVARAPDARLAYVTPSHQYPLGVTMSLSRRLRLLEWARTAGSWIIEDDYDSEYRYATRPLSSLQGLDDGQRVIYVGSFNKVLVPAIRIGFLVVPSDLVEVFSYARIISGRATPQLDQAAMADFIREGHLSRHIRKLRSLLGERQESLIDALRSRLGGLLDVSPRDAGMHLIGMLPAGVDDRRVSREARAREIDAPPLSGYAVESLERGGLVIGYGSVPARDMVRAVDRLAEAIERVVGRRDRSSSSRRSS